MSAATGPRQTVGGLARGFAHTQAGAVVAAVHLLVRTTAQVGPAVFDPTLPTRWSARRRRDARARSPPTTRRPPPPPASSTASRWVTCPPRVAGVRVDALHRRPATCRCSPPPSTRPAPPATPPPPSSWPGPAGLAAGGPARRAVGQPGPHRRPGPGRRLPAAAGRVSACARRWIRWPAWTRSPKASPTRSPTRSPTWPPTTSTTILTGLTDQLHAGIKVLVAHAGRLDPRPLHQVCPRHRRRLDGRLRQRGSLTGGAGARLAAAHHRPGRRARHRCGRPSP